jgi:hypothetical protein
VVRILWVSFSGETHDAKTADVRQEIYRRMFAPQEHLWQCPKGVAKSLGGTRLGYRFFGAFRQSF